MPASNPTTVTVSRPSGFDRHGDPEPAETHDIEGCTWWPRAREGEELNRQSGNAVIIGLTLTGPVDADIRSTDMVLFPGDPDPWYVEGEPGRRVSPFGSSRLDHFEVALTRQKG